MEKVCLDHIRVSDVQRELGCLSAPDLVRCHTLMLAHNVLRHGELEESTLSNLSVRSAEH